MVHHLPLHLLRHADLNSSTRSWDFYLLADLNMGCIRTNLFHTNLWLLGHYLVNDIPGEVETKTK